MTASDARPAGYYQPGPPATADETLIPVLAGAELTGVRMVAGMVDRPAEAAFALPGRRTRRPGDRTVVTRA